jgi:hypothetical protein
MGADPMAEFQLAQRQQLIERSKKIIVNSKVLIEQSRRRIRIAMGHDVDNGNKIDAP